MCPETRMIGVPGLSRLISRANLKLIIQECYHVVMSLCGLLPGEMTRCKVISLEYGLQVCEGTPRMGYTLFVRIQIFEEGDQARYLSRDFLTMSRTYCDGQDLDGPDFSFPHTS